MARFSEKILVAFLALLLGLSPLQGAMAGLASSFAKDGSAHHQMSDMPCDMHMESSHGAKDGNQCDKQSDCADHSCASGHCATCVLAIMPDFPNPINPVNTHEFHRAQDGLVDQRSSSLFRPPRV